MNDQRAVYFIIGHRGTGKSTWARSVCLFLKKQKRSALFLDIDKELEKKTNKSINQLFEKGEIFFREQENQCVKECIEKAKKFNGLSFISAGAGYQGAIPSLCRVIHLKRSSDKEGRIFFDRPKLKAHLNPYDEYKNFYLKRELLYKKKRDFVFVRPEHFKSFEKWDEVFFGKSLPFKNAVITLKENELKKRDLYKNKFDLFLEQKLKWDLKFFEIKDNEISEEFLREALEKIPSSKILFSFRKKNSSLFLDAVCSSKILKKNEDFFKNHELVFDWPIEWRENKKLNPEIYSFHHRKNNIGLKEQLDHFSKYKKAHLKLAIEILSFKELWHGHLWWKEDSSRRSFHPRSKEGRWKWYRLLFGPHQPLYFICEDNENDILDQPLIAESVRLGHGISKNGFATVLGNPVWHSATPYEQESFFRKYDLSVLEIPMKEQEMTFENIKILEKMGLKFSAITSPLKKKAYNIMRKFDVKKKKKIQNNLDIPSVNTILLTKEGWKGFNTDADGMDYFLKRAENFLNQKKYDHPIDQNKNIAVWGGGGVRDILKKKLRMARFYSARTGQLLETKNKTQSFVFQKLLKNKEKQLSDDSFKNEQSEKFFKPEIVIWAVPRSRMPSCKNPPSWKPLCVLDLNYSEDSPGREYALSVGAYYVSGWAWFKAQASGQRQLFEHFYKNI